jgi:micrococcal nuclease
LPLALAAFLLVLPSCSRVYEAGPDPCRPQTRVHVESFVDGDTLDVTVLEGDLEGTEERVRLSGVDTPETHGEGAPECWGQEASDESVSFLEGQDAYLTFDVECSDFYDRTLAYVYRARDGAFLQRHLVEEGFARACPFPEYDPENDAFTERLADWEEEARNAGRGLWGEPCYGEGDCF